MKSKGVIWAVLLVAGLAATGTCAALDPKLDPGTAPAPTFKTLDQIPPTWDQVIAVDKRFTSVLGATAFLDRETGLVWERAPHVGLMTWIEAHTRCLRIGTVRKGWRLPSMSELASLAVPASGLAGSIKLIDGHPFEATLDEPWWSSSVYLDASNLYAWVLGRRGGGGIGGALVREIEILPRADAVAGAWCVRGGRGTDLQ